MCICFFFLLCGTESNLRVQAEKKYKHQRKERQNKNEKSFIEEGNQMTIIKNLIKENLTLLFFF